MSDLDRILQLAGREAQEQAQDLTNERELKADEVCEKCGCDTANPVEGCECSHDETNEAVGDSASGFYRLQDEFAGGEADGAHKVLIDELVRYLSGDQLEDFVSDFERHYDMVGDMEESTMSDEEKERAMNRAMQSVDEPERGTEKKKVSLKKAPWEESINEAGGYYTKEVYDMIDQHGVAKVMHELLTAMDADDLQGVISRMRDSLKEADENQHPYVCVHAKKGKHECHAETSYDAAQKAAKHWKLKSTSGIDAYKADIDHVAEDDVDENAFNQAAAAAARDGKDSFEFGGKTHKTTMKKDTAHKLDESGCACCDGADGCECSEDCSNCDCNSAVNEAPTMDTTQMITLMRNAGLSEDTIDEKLNEWANSAAGAAELESTSHGEPYENFAQAVNLSLKKYLDAEDMKVQVSEHKVEDMKALYEAKKATKS